MARLIAAILTTTFLMFSTAAAQENGTGESSPARSDIDLLIDVIEDDAARAELIDRLRATGERSEETPADAVAEALGEETNPPPDLSFGRRIATVTQAIAEGIAERAADTWRQLSRSGSVLDGFSGREVGVLAGALSELAFVIVITVVVFVALRPLGKSIYRRMGASARDGGLARSVSLFLASGLIDALNVIVAWAAGYAIALLALGEFGQIGIRQTLYLNAFLLVEMAKVAVRLILSPTSGSLRPIPLSNAAARYLNTRLNLVVSLVGYGQLLVVPIINANISFAAGTAMSTLIAFVVLAMLVWLVLRNRNAVADWMLGADTPVPTDENLAEAQPPRRRGALGHLARHWHWPALVYLFAMFFVVLLRPGNAAFQTFVASGQVLVVGLLGFALSGLLGGVIARGVSLPHDVSERLPLLETRLNRFVPRTLFLLRLAIFVLVTLFALDAISVIDIRAWLTSQIGLRLSAMAVSVALILLASFAIWLALTSWVDYRLNPQFGQVATSRERTLLTLLRNAATIALIIITLMFVLAEIGLDIAPLLASAGVLGLAIGFGAQKMVQDIITGIFIQFENAMNVGDVVSVGGTTGTVERLTIRSVSLRDVNGVFHVIPFSSVDMVSNYVRDFGYFVCDMGVAYRENIDEVKQAMLDGFEELKSDPERAAKIMGDLEWFGLQSFGDSAVVLRARIKCVPGQQWGIGREYNAILKRIFDDRNIEIPFPHQTIFLGESKDGKTQRFRIETAAEAT